MGVDYEPITKAARQARYKKTAPVLVLGNLTTLVSPAISGAIRHVVDVTVQPLSGSTGVVIVAQDASGASSTIARATWGPKSQFYTPGNMKNPVQWTPERHDIEDDDELYLLHANSVLKAMGEENSSGGCYATTTFWDEGGPTR